MTDREMRLFREACGSPGPIVLGVEEPGTSGVSWRVFDQPFLVVGRDPGADLFLNDGGVSRRHAYLQVVAGRLFGVDLKSRTGTRWGDEPGLWGWVRPDPGIRVGPFRLRPGDDGPGEEPAREADAPPLPVPVSRSFVQPELAEASLEILGGPAGASRWRISRSLVLIGSSRACKVRLPGVADVHASIVRTPSGLFAVDLMGRGGVCVNGVGARCVRIADKDEISIGGHRIRVRLGGFEGVGGPPEILAGAVTNDLAASLVRSMFDEFARAQHQMTDRLEESIMVVLRAFAGSDAGQVALIREELARLREPSREPRAIGSRAEGKGLIAIGPNAIPAASSSRLAPTPLAATTEGVGGRASRRDPGPADEADPSDLHGRIIGRIAEIHDEREGRWQRLLKAFLD